LKDLQWKLVNSHQINKCVSSVFAETNSLRGYVGNWGRNRLLGNQLDSFFRFNTLIFNFF
jgi:hypothetical protein